MSKRKQHLKYIIRPPRGDKSEGIFGIFFVFFFIGGLRPPRTPTVAPLQNLRIVLGKIKDFSGFINRFGLGMAIFY